MDRCLIWTTVLLVANLAAGGDVPRHVMESQLQTSLMQGYSRDVRPSKEAVSIALRPQIIRIEDIDESIDVLTLTLALEQVWNDSRLSWTVSASNWTIKETRLPLEKIWKPDLQQYNYFEGDPGPLYEGYASVSNTGRISFHAKWSLGFYCPLDLTKFPYDTQTCVLSFGSAAHDTSKMSLSFLMPYNRTSSEITVAADEEIQLSGSAHPSWEVVGGKASALIKEVQLSCCPETYSQVDITVQLKRKRSFFRYLMVGPGVILALLVPMQFLLPTQSAQRNTYGMLVIACLVTLVTNFQLYSPFDSSSVPRIGVFYVVTVIFAAVSTKLSTMVTSLADRASRRKSVPFWASKLFSVLLVRRFLCLGDVTHATNLYSSLTNRRFDTVEETVHPSGSTEVSRDSNTSGSEVYLRRIGKTAGIMAAKSQELDDLDKLKEEWCDLCTGLDRVLFIVFSFMFVVSAISLLAVYDV